MGKIAVAPLVGAWIEIAHRGTGLKMQQVAPLVGAWIEIFMSSSFKFPDFPSLPLWERGLKSTIKGQTIIRVLRRSPCGSVD